MQRASDQKYHIIDHITIPETNTGISKGNEKDSDERDIVQELAERFHCIVA